MGRGEGETESRLYIQIFLFQEYVREADFLFKVQKETVCFVFIVRFIFHLGEKTQL